jgi:cytochrome c553
MPADFTLIQLFLFRQGTRKIEIMNDLAKDMTDDDLRKFSEYFSKLPPPKASGEAADPQTAARAQAVIAANHCASCHNPDFSGREQMPRLRRAARGLPAQGAARLQGRQAARL